MFPPLVFGVVRGGSEDKSRSLQLICYLVVAIVYAFDVSDLTRGLAMCGGLEIVVVFVYRQQTFDEKLRLKKTVHLSKLSVIVFVCVYLMLARW